MSSTTVDKSLAREWENPRCSGVNREPAHAAYYASEDRATALAGRKHSSRHLNLNGDWRFRWASTATDQPAAADRDGFARPEYDDSGWDTIAVPGNWELAGPYGFPIYTNIEYVFKHSPPTIEYKGKEPGPDYVRRGRSSSFGPQQHHAAARLQC